MSTLSFDQFMKQGGATQSDQIQSVGVNMVVPKKEKTAKPGFLKRVGEDFAARREDISKINTSDQNIGSKILQNVGEVAGGAGDILFEGIKSVTPDFIEEPISSAATAVAETKPVQDVANKYKTWAEQHPEAAGNLEATLNIASLIPEFKGIEAATKAGSVGIKSLEGASEVIKDATKSGVTKVGSKLKQAGETAYDISVGMEEPTKIALQNYQATQPSLWGRVKNIVTGEKAPIDEKAVKPITESNTAIRKGLVGTEWSLGTQAKQVSDSIWKDTISPALKKTNAKVNMPTFVNEIRDEIISKTPDLNRRNILLEALDSFSQDFKKVNNFGIDKLQQYKEGWAKFVPEASYKGKPIGGALNEIRNLASQKARNIIYKTLGDDIKQAYLDYGNLQSIEKAGIKSVDPLRSKGISKQAWEFLLDKAVTPVATVGGQILYKTGEGLEFLGKSGAKQVKDVVN